MQISNFGHQVNIIIIIIFLLLFFYFLYQVNINCECRGVPIIPQAHLKIECFTEPQV